MTALTIILFALCILLCATSVGLYVALVVAVDEREMCYTPIKPIDFEILDGEVEDEEY